MLHGLRARIIAGFFCFSGVFCAAVSAAQEAGLFSFIPQKYLWIPPIVTGVALALNSFTERVQGGASKPEVRNAARKADEKKLLDEINSTLLRAERE